MPLVFLFQHAAYLTYLHPYFIHILAHIKQIERPSTRAYFNPTAAYVLVGCLGGLGRSLAVWMVERGARHLVFLSRTGAGTVESTSVIEELTSMGSNPTTIRCDVTDHDALKSAVDQISSQYPIKGVVHAAMVEGVSLEISILYPIYRREN